VRVFVAGASGAVGRPLITQLVAAGHEVTGMTRREERAAEIRAEGAGCAVCDVFDQQALNEAVAAAEPEVVIHQLTALPQELDPRKKGIYDANNRIRHEGTSNLVGAARAAGARRMVAQSIAFIYAPTGGWVKTEDDPVISIPGEFGRAVEATMSLEQQVIETEGIDGLVLRYGFFYGPGTSYAPDGHQASEVRRRRFPIIGDGAGTFSFVHVEDAASAAVAATERGHSGIYNVADDEPAPMADLLRYLADQLGAPTPRKIPTLAARLLAGRDVVALLSSSIRLSNRLLREELGFEPRFTNYRQGFAAVLSEPVPEPA
jgi:nucleoside-diphosphate-sugar epimerase